MSKTYIKDILDTMQESFEKGTLSISSYEDFKNHLNEEADRKNLLHVTNFNYELVIASFYLSHQQDCYYLLQRDNLLYRAYFLKYIYEIHNQDFRFSYTMGQITYRQHIDEVITLNIISNGLLTPILHSVVNKEVFYSNEERPTELNKPLGINFQDNLLPEEMSNLEEALCLKVGDIYALLNLYVTQYDENALKETLNYCYSQGLEFTGLTPRTILEFNESKFLEQC